MSVLMEFALEAGLIDHNPVRDVKKISAKSDGFHTWTVAEVAACEVRHPVGTMARLAMDLMLYTGLRRSDVVRVGRSHITGDVLSIQPVKRQRSSGVTVTVRILPALAESSSKTATGEKPLLISDWNKPFAVKGLGNWFRDRCDEAGVPGSAHGLRKAAATKYAENGAPASELMAMFGWTTLQEAERYTRLAEKRGANLECRLQKSLPHGLYRLCRKSRFSLSGRQETRRLTYGQALRVDHANTHRENTYISPSRTVICSSLHYVVARNLELNSNSENHVSYAGIYYYHLKVRRFKEP